MIPYNSQRLGRSDSECWKLIFTGTSHNISLSDTEVKKKKKKLQPKVIFCILLKGAANELDSLSSEEEEEDDEDKEENKIIRHHWQLPQAILEKCRQRLKALKILTFALLSQGIFSNSFFFFFPQTLVSNMQQKKSCLMNLRYGKALVTGVCAIFKRVCGLRALCCRFQL